VPLTKEQIQEIFDKITSGNYAESDLSTLRQALDQGEISLATGDRAVALGGDANDTVIVTGDNNIVRVNRQIDVEAMRQILHEIFPSAVTAQNEETAYFEPEMVLIPGGHFYMGSSSGPDVSAGETPRSKIMLPDYYISSFPITNAQYSEFIKSKEYPVAQESGWDGMKPPSNKQDHPIKGINWFDALAYCEWLAETTGKPYCMPTEAHWEKAARGSDGRRYPWGEEWDAERCNWNRNDTKPVDHFPPQSPYACYDMVGNVREWTSSLWGEKRSQPDPRFQYPWQEDARNDENAHKQIRRVLRGGAYVDQPKHLTCATRFSCLPDQSGIIDNLSGFRIMMQK
jgi:formylglycine-generating enzyme required for sulfatase activity